MTNTAREPGHVPGMAYLSGASTRLMHTFQGEPTGRLVPKSVIESKIDLAIISLLLITASMTSLELAERVTVYDFILVSAIGLMTLRRRPVVVRSVALGFGTILAAGSLAALDLTLSDFAFATIVNNGAIFLGLGVFYVLSRSPVIVNAKNTVLASLLFANLVHFAFSFSQGVRPNGLARFPNELGNYGNGVLLVALFAGAGANPTLRAATAVSGFGIIMVPQSRAAFVLGLLQLGVFIWSTYAADARLLFMSAVGLFCSALVVLTVGLPSFRIFERLGDGADKIEGGEFFYFDNWQRGLELFAENPLIGVGSKNARVSSFDLREGTEAFIVHNAAVNILASTGLVGAVLFIIVMRKTWFRIGVLPTWFDRVALFSLAAVKIGAAAAINTRGLWLSIPIFLALRGGDRFKETPRPTTDSAGTRQHKR